MLLVEIKNQKERIVAESKKSVVGQTTYSLFEFTRAFLAYAVAHGVKSFPSPNSQLWHQWLYTISSKRPTLISGIERFDWDGSNPKHPRWTEVVVRIMRLFHERPSDGRMVMLDEEIKRAKDFVGSLRHDRYGLAAFGYAQANYISGFFEKEKIAPAQTKKQFRVSIAVAVFIANEERKLLMVRRAEGDDGGGKWGFSAGSMDAHEDPMTAAVREAKEETGFDVELVDLLRVLTIDRGDDVSGLAFTFRARIVGGEMSLPSNEISDCRYFALDEIEAMLDRGEIYKPEYNIANLKNWCENRSYPLDIIQPLVR